MSPLKQQKTSGGDETNGGGGATVGQEANKRSGLITVNDLNYVLEPDLSVAVNRTFKKHFSQSNEYTNNQRAIFIFNSGADYIDTRRSYLSLEAYITEPSNADGYFGLCGSACNLIDNILITTRSGDEICRITDFALLQNMMLPLTYNEDWFRTVGACMGYGSRISNRKEGEDNTALVSGQVGGARRFLIPMYVLAPFFQYGRLMPAHVMAGLRVEIEWNQPSKAFIGVKHDRTGATNKFGDIQANISSYVIKSPYFVCESIQLSDSIQRALNETSATTGLEIIYCDWERTESAVAGAAPVAHIEVRKACSRALKAFARIRATVPNVKEGQKDTFRGEMGFPVIEYQWQLGSLYFPQQPVKSSTDDIYNHLHGCSAETYIHTLEAVDKFHADSQQPYLSYTGIQKYSTDGDHLADTLVNGVGGPGWSLCEDVYTPGVDLNSFLYDGNTTFLGKPGSFANDQHVLAVNLERTPMFPLAGVPVNNSRVLALRLRMSDKSKEASGDPDFANQPGAVVTLDRRIITIFLKYIKLARIFMNNVEVEQ